MEISRHPGYIEIKMPELFDVKTRRDNLARTFTAIQPGTRKLLIDASNDYARPRIPDDSEIVHLSRSIADALESMSDSMELIAVLARPRQIPAIEPCLRRLESLGFDIRLFSQRDKALGWIGH